MPKSLDELRQRFAAAEAEAREVAKRKVQEQAEREAAAQIEREVAEAEEERIRRANEKLDAHFDREKIRAARSRARDEHLRPVGLGRARWAETTDAEGDEDAVLQFGKYSGRSVSQLCYDATTLDYLRWLYRADFPERLKEIVFKQLSKRAARV